MRNFAFALGFVIVSCTGAASQEEEDEAICPDAVTTVDIVECLGEVHGELDIMLNDAYRAAIEPLEGERRTALRDAQRAWVTYRDANCRFYSLGDGTIARIEGASCMVEMTRSRSDELEGVGQP